MRDGNSLSWAINIVIEHFKKKIYNCNQLIEEDYKNGVFEIYITRHYDNIEKYEKVITAIDKEI